MELPDSISATDITDALTALGITGAPADLSIYIEPREVTVVQPRRNAAGAVIGNMTTSIPID